MKKTKKQKNCEKSVYFGDFALSMTINFYHFFLNCQIWNQYAEGVFMIY